MTSLARVPIEGGGTILFEAAAQSPHEGPVKAGRIGDAAHDLPHTLQQMLDPVRDAAAVVLDKLRQASPDEVEVEFGVDLSAQAGAIIAKGESAVHFKVRVLWQRQGSPVDTI